MVFREKGGGGGESENEESLSNLFITSIGHFRVPPYRPLYQSEVKCPAFDVEIIFNSHANKT